MLNSSNPVVYAPTQLPQELEPHAHSKGTYLFQLPQNCIKTVAGINNLSADDRFEMEQDRDADQEGPASDNGYDSSEEYHDCAVDQDQGFASSSPIDNQVLIFLSDTLCSYLDIQDHFHPCRLSAAASQAHPP
jgi:hypothetical protein